MPPRRRVGCGSADPLLARPPQVTQAYIVRNLNELTYLREKLHNVEELLDHYRNLWSHTVRGGTGGPLMVDRLDRSIFYLSSLLLLLCRRDKSSDPSCALAGGACGKSVSTPLRTTRMRWSKLSLRLRNSSSCRPRCGRRRRGGGGGGGGLRPPHPPLAAAVDGDRRGPALRS